MATLVFDWDPAKAASNVAKHRVRFEDAMTVFRDPLALSVVDADSSVGEERWITLGAGSGGALLRVVQTWTEIDENRATVRTVSARRPNRDEARQDREGP